MPDSRSLDSVTSVELSPREFVQLYTEGQVEIRHVRVIPAKVGDRHNFGRIRVVYVNSKLGVERGK